MCNGVTKWWGNTDPPLVTHLSTNEPRRRTSAGILFSPGLVPIQDLARETSADCDKPETKLPRQMVLDSMAVVERSEPVDSGEVGASGSDALGSFLRDSAHGIFKRAGFTKNDLVHVEQTVRAYGGWDKAWMVIGKSGLCPCKKCRGDDPMYEHDRFEWLIKFINVLGTADVALYEVNR